MVKPQTVFWYSQKNHCKNSNSPWTSRVNRYSLEKNTCIQTVRSCGYVHMFRCKPVSSATKVGISRQRPRPWLNVETETTNIKVVETKTHRDSDFSKLSRPRLKNLEVVETKTGQKLSRPKLFCTILLVEFKRLIYLTLLAFIIEIDHQKYQDFDSMRF